MADWAYPQIGGQPNGIVSPAPEDRQHEFSAEGEREAVERQVDEWRKMIASIPTLPSPPPAPPQSEGSSQANPPMGVLPSEDFTEYDRVFRHDDKVVSLTVLPRGDAREADAALLIMLGRKHYKGEDLVGGTRLLEGLEISGLQVLRADRVFGAYMGTHVTRVGKNRAVKYRLTNQGMACRQGYRPQLGGLGSLKDNRR